MIKASSVFIKSFGFLLPALLASSFVLFYFVLNVFRGMIFGLDDAPIWLMLIFRGVNFQEIFETPLIYLSSIALVSALLGAIWTGFIIPRFPRLIWLQILILPWVAVILTGAVWGLIWSINHWPADSFRDHETMMLFRRTDIINGLSYSWLSAAQSYPLNILSYGVYCGLLLLNKKFFLRELLTEQKSIKQAFRG
jgi:hypothetical protein